MTGGGRREIRDKVPDILRLTGLSTKLHNYPDQLSGGEQQRVAIARAFVNHPPLLIADEPTGNLDPETSIGIMQLLYRINQTGTTVLVATHDVAMVDKMRRRVIELADGQIVRDEQAGAYAARESTREFADPHAERPGMRPVFFLREALRALKRNAIPSFAAMATVLVTVLVLGVFIPVVQATTGAANEVRGKVIADVYLKTDVKQTRHRPRRPAAATRSRSIGKRRVHLQGAGLRDREEAQPEGLRAARLQPAAGHLPRHAGNPDDIGKIKDALAPAGRRAAGARSSTPRSTRSATARRTRTRSSRVTRVVKITMALLAGLLGIASMLLIANTIRLSLYARRREVEVMKLVGATDWFIRWPFVLEGVIVGALGGVLAILLLAVVKIAVVDPLAADFALIAAPDTIDFRLLIGSCCCSPPSSVSALGSGLSLRKFLRV